jgi:lysozyme family protein
MSNFYFAIEKILMQEGYYSNDPSDPGGATKYGISLRFLKSIGEFDGDIDGNGDIDIDDIKKMSKKQAVEIYKKYWWEKYEYNRIISQGIATKVLSISINMGHIQAHKCTQRAVRAAIGHKINEDGILGKITIMNINKANPDILLASIKSEAAGFYRSLNNPNYINGWLNRAYD